jgi:hypothetical protein
MGSTPCFCALTATPARVWVCSTQPTSGRASCTALWITKPAGLTGKGESMQLVALLVDLDQAAGGDFVEHQAVGVDQEVVLGPGDALGADVGEHQVAPAVQRHQPVAGGEVDAQLPLFGLTSVFQGRDVHGGLQGFCGVAVELTAGRSGFPVAQGTAWRAVAAVIGWVPHISRDG